jgi:dephospho-CoA kinase
MKVIGVIGKNGSGKDEVLKYLRDSYEVPFLSTGDIVRGIAAEEGKEPTRLNLQAISDRYFKERGDGCFVRMVVDKIRENGWKSAGISGVRSAKDVDILRGELGEDFVLIDVYVSDPRVRFERMLTTSLCSRTMRRRSSSASIRRRPRRITRSATTARWMICAS